MFEVDYGDLTFSERRKLDLIAYSKYYRQTESALTYNSWYGTKFHEKYLNILLRKMKLEKINKVH